MFERYITNALTTHFGHILENVDSDKMRLSAWDGELTLEDVAIKSSALDTILRGPENTPVEIAYGHIGAFRMKIPWSLLSGLISGSGSVDDSNTSSDATGAAAAISVVLTDVDILITPRRKVVVVNSNTENKNNEENRNREDEIEDQDLQASSEITLDARRAEKERKVQSLLDANLLKRVTESSMLAAESKKDKKGSWAAWFQEKLTQLLSNLSITVTNIHIRYEDPGTSMGFEWKIYHHEQNNSDLVNQYSNLSLNMHAAGYSPLRRRVSNNSVAGGNFQPLDDGYRKPRRFRPAFAVGITLKEFSVQTTRAPKKKQQSQEGDERSNEENRSTAFDDTSTSAVSASTTTSTNAGLSTIAANDFIIRRQHKRAAADDLAIYWDSTTTLISGSAIRKFELQQQNLRQRKDGPMADHQTRQTMKKELFDFYQSCFSMLNDGSPSSSKTGARHSYLLDPVSPSVDLALVSKLPVKPQLKQPSTISEEDSDDESTEALNLENVKASETNFTVPSSSVKIELPPCTFTLSRNTLEDTVYLRKSMSVWNGARKTLVSEAALRRVIKLRPSESAMKDPTGWWKYAFEATKLMTRASLSPETDEMIYEEEMLDGSQYENRPLDDKRERSCVQRKLKPLTRRKGWVGLVEAVIRRRKYVKLYKIILEPPSSLESDYSMERERQKMGEEEAHKSLLKMEDELLAREIVAFRIHAYKYMKEQRELDGHKTADVDDVEQKISQTVEVSSDCVAVDDNESRNKGRWATWIGTGTNESDDTPIPNMRAIAEGETKEAESERNHVMVKGETDEEMLSIEHRRWMMNEMKQALDREKSNMQSWEREGTQRSSLLRMTKNVLLAGDMPNDESNPVVWTASLICRKFAIQINDQLFDPSRTRHKRSVTPLVRMSSAWVHRQSWFQDRSWDVDLSFASMQVIDLVSGRGKYANSRYVSTLLGSNSRPGNDDNEFLVINGIRYHRNMSVKIKRRLHWNMPVEWIHHESNIDRGSTTTVQVQVLPMEIIYSALPIEKVKQVFLTVKTPELVDDYHKVLGVAQSWRNKQKERLLDTLAHKNKQIIVDIDIAAPEVLIPENIYRPDSPMLAINLGRFQAYNDNERLENKNTGDFDHQWRVLVSNIQVQSTSMASYHSRSPSGLQHEQLVEPFSIDFVVSTKVIKLDEQNDVRESRINVSATLPRLAFNITSSAIRLISRLRANSAKRERETRGETMLYDTYSALYEYPELTDTSNFVQSEKVKKDSRQASGNTNRSPRVFKFIFSAPAITLKLENDVDGRDCLNEHGSKTTPILDLALRSIRGSFSQELTRSGDSMTKFEAKLRSLGVIDLYQNAGEDFILLMSSVPYSQLCGEMNIGRGYSWDGLHANYDADERNKSSEDLVKVEYTSSMTAGVDSGVDGEGIEMTDDSPDKISLWFHELYIEWNPETIAAIHAAIGTPPSDDKDSRTSDESNIIVATNFDEDEASSEDEFFDAVEEELDEPSDSGSFQPISEISTSADDLPALWNRWSDTSTMYGVSSPVVASPTIGGGLIGQGRFSFSPGSRSSFGVGQFYSARMFESGYVDTLQLPRIETKPDPLRNLTKARRKDITFKLSKLRVSFNKETRNRKLIVAQMDRTLISYSTRTTGGSKIRMNLGNLVFIDPAHVKNKTLYGQILGLQSKSMGVNENSYSSLLEMEVIMNPKIREFSKITDSDRSNTVTIDREGGKMAGSNTCVTAKLSPMRFVLIEQLWMEFMDYFFQGIISTEVLGGQKKGSTSSGPLGTIGLNPIDSDFVYGSDADGISFTRFDITLESPVIIFPVTYCSPDYLRMKLCKIRFANEYDGAIVTDTGFGIDRTQNDRMQWFNNCKISLDGLRLYSWTGRELGCNSVDGCVSLRWPTGQLAPLIIPKWRVNCSFDALDLSLCRSDYALLQNILSFNIGEPSRHMDEWRVLQTLSPQALEELMEKITVHYGYDQKNVAPTTYDVRLSVPLFKVRFLESDNQKSEPLAIARCFDFKWQMRKESDLIVKQKLTCGIDLVRPSQETASFETLMTISKDNSDFDGEKENKDRARPDFIYSSTSFPDGDNVKTVHIFDPCIYVVVPAWRRFTAFFQSLTAPIFLTEKEIGTSIQVGDRWYRIGDDNTSPSNPHIPLGMGNVGKESFSWISSECTSSMSTGLSATLPATRLPTRQIKLLLTWPRIILSSVTNDEDPTRVILRMNHFEFLQTTDESKLEKTRALFLHDVEVYTSSQKLSTRSTSHDEENNSLIRPWSLSATSKTSDGESIEDYEKLTCKISGDVLRARAAYSDMSIAVDVFLSILHSAKGKSSDVTRNDLPQHPVLSNRSFDSVESLTTDSSDEEDRDNERTTLSSTLYEVEFDGFELKVADDRYVINKNRGMNRHFSSGCSRHFA